MSDPREFDRLTPQAAVAKLNALGTEPDAGHDAYEEHHQADAILLAVLRDNGMAAVAEAFEQARSRCEFWYS